MTNFDYSEQLFYSDKNAKIGDKNNFLISLEGMTVAGNNLAHITTCDDLKIELKSKESGPKSQKLIYEISGVEIVTLDELLLSLEKRLDFFVSKGCRMADHGMDRFPENYAGYEEAVALFEKRSDLSPNEVDSLKGFLLVWLSKEYAKRNITVQLHFAVTRNVNPKMFALCGADSGFDVISETPSVKNIIGFLSQIPDEERPNTILYTLNDANLSSIACVSGAYRKVRMGAAWWFNDTVEGIRRNLKIISEYSNLGNNLGMLTDSRSFSSYCRFDFFRRILCDFVGNLVEKGEYDNDNAINLVENICYYNAKRMVD